MVSLKQQRQSGFTIVELLIVIIIIGILIGLVVTQILGASAKARDTERKTDLDNIANQLETYYGKASGYPSLADLNDATWRKNNEVSMGDNNKALYDPSATTTAPTSTIPASVQLGAYTYIPTVNGTASTSCVSPTNNATTPVANTGTFCNGYQLTALLENSKDKDTATVTNGTATQYQFTKKNATNL